MADNTIDNLSIQVTASAEEASRIFDRLASNARKLQDAVSSAADSMDDMADSTDDANTATQDASEQSGRATRNFGALWNAIKRAGNVIGGSFVGVLRIAGKSLSNFITGIARIAKFRIYRTIIKDLGQSFKDLYGYSDAFGTKFADSMDKITTALTYLRNSIAAMTAPLINALAPALDLITDKIVGALNWLNEFFAALTGASTFTVAKKIAVSFGDAISSSGKKAKKASDDIKRTILDFDEINKLVAPKDSSGGSSGSSPYSDNYKKMFEERNVSGGLKLFSNALEKSLKDSLSRIGLIVSGASLAVGAILALSGANIPLGLGLMATGVSGIAMTLSWNGLDGEVYSSLKKIMGLASLASLAIGMILAFTGVNVPLGVGLIAAGAVGVAAQINWGALTGNVYGSLKSINKLISMASMAIGAILLLTGVNPALGLGLVAGGIVGAAANMDWTSTEKDVYNSLKRIMKIVSLGSVAVGAVLLFAGVNKGLGIGLIAAGMAGAAASMDWSSLDSNVYNSLKSIYKIATKASFAIGLILALTGVATPLGIGLMAAGAVGTAASLNWNSLKDKVVTKWEEIKKSVLEIWADMKAGASDMSKWVEDKVTTAWNTVSAWTSSKWTSIKTTASNIWNNMKENSSTTFNTIGETIVNGWNNVRNSLSNFAAWISSGFGNLWSTAWTGIVTTFGNIFSGLGDLVREPINAIIEFLNSLISKVETTINRIRRKISNAIKIDIPAVDNPWPWPDFPGIYWKPLNLQDISIRRIDYLASGGIVDGATMLGFNGYNPIVAGEAGREAVLPLDSHTEWMDELSDRIGSNSDVVRILNDVRNILSQINAKEFSTEISTASINKAQARMNRRAGMTITPVTQ